MRISTLLTAALLGLLLWASCTQAEEEASKEAAEEAAEEAADEASDEESDEASDEESDEASDEDEELEEEEKPKKPKTTEIEEENDVMVLHIHNFARALSENKYLLVEFYAPWCGHCKRLEPAYTEAAARLKQEEGGLRLAKVDAIEEKELGQEFDVGGYPTIKLFVDGDRTQAKEYTGGRSAQGMVTWMKRQASAGVPVLDSPSAITQFIEAHNVSVVAFFKDMESEAAKVVDELYFSSALEIAKTSSVELFQKYEVTTDSVVLFKKFDEGRVDFLLAEGKLDKDNLTSFIRENSLELIISFNPEKSEAIFGSSIKLHNLMFVNASTDAHMALVEETRSVAKQFKGKILFVLLDISVEMHGQIMDYFGVKASDTPTVRMFEMTSQKKYSLSPEPFSAEAVAALCQGVLDGTAQAFYKTEEVPENWDKAPVKVLVGKNFKAVAQDPTKNVFVKFYAPWCHFCKEMAPIWEQLGEKYADHADIIIAKFDATANEAEGVQVNGFPTLIYYPAEGKEVQYHGEHTLEKMSEFLDNGGVEPETPEEPEDDEEDEEDEAEDEAAPDSAANTTVKEEL